jgi:RNA-directed DNA polymerase
MTDRAMQALYLLGLDPIVETQADGHSYGFRLERCCADAIEQCHLLLGNRYGPRWILEGDIKSCFDRISHSWLLDHVPLDKDILRAWLDRSWPFDFGVSPSLPVVCVRFELPFVAKSILESGLAARICLV